MKNNVNRNKALALGRLLGKYGAPITGYDTNSKNNDINLVGFNNDVDKTKFTVNPTKFGTS